MVTSGREGIRLPTSACPAGEADQTVALTHCGGIVVAAFGSSSALIVEHVS
jgi:hypothetical protein